jgi:ferredoxin
VRCVACQLCEFICPPRAIKIMPGEIPASDRFAKVEKYPEEFDIDMIRCIYCGMCESLPGAGDFSAQGLRDHGSPAPRWCITNKADRDRRRAAWLVLKWNEQK